MRTQTSAADVWLGVGTIVLAIALAANTVLGPLITGLIEYPFTDTVRNETLGLEAVSLVLIAPLAFLAGVGLLRRRAGAALLALGPAAYASYMLVQYVLGPQYPTYQPSIILHLAMFVLSGTILVRAWGVAGALHLPTRSRGWAVVVFAMAGFVASRWIPALLGTVTNEPIPAAPPDVTMYWSIFLLDLGIVVPVAVATGVGLLRRRPWAQRALYGVVGWFSLVPPSVAAMSLVKLMRPDANASPADAILFVVVTLVFWAVAAALAWPVVRRRGGAERHPHPTAAEVAAY